MEGFTNFNPDMDIPSLEGKVIFVTGGTGGLGRTSVCALAKHNPAHIYFSGRNRKAGAALIAEIKQTIPNAKLTFIELDLASLASVRTGIEHFVHPRLDILMCNAGVMALPPALSKDGFEIQFATNHLGHAMLVRKLLPTLQRTAEQPGSDVRIVILTSLGWQFHPKDGVSFDTLRTVQNRYILGPWYRYGQSKFANLVYAQELARRYPKITSVSVHPGIIATDLVNTLGLFQRIFVYVTCLGQFVKVEQGVLSQLWAAACAKKEEILNGAFYRPVGVMSNSMFDDLAKSEEFGRALWEWTEKTLDEFSE